MRVFASDLDGTLIRPDGTVGPTTLDALNRAAEAGIRIALVTGRPPRWMVPIADALGHLGTAICANGAAAVDLAAGVVTATTPIEHSIALAVMTDLRDRFGDQVHLAVERVEVGTSLSALAGGGSGGSRFLRESGFVPGVAAPEPGPADLGELAAAGNIIKILARFDAPVPAVGIYEEGVEVTGDRLSATRSHNRLLLEMGPAGVTKASALADLVTGWGMGAQDVVAAGDMPNDRPMLHWAGWAVAIQGGDPEVLTVADEVVPGPERDGLVGVLERMIRSL